jgi:steroid 5-alpha reductase family enzyme
MNPLIVCVWICAAGCLGTWLLSIATREQSWVDRVWSLLPPAYLWVFAASAGLGDARLNTMAVLVTLWGTRLTANLARKGGYAPGGEDYRWAILRARMTPRQAWLFNVFFVTIYQNLLLLAISLPALTARLHRETAFGVLDVAAAGLFLVLLAGETAADQQQWDFHRSRPRGQGTGTDSARKAAPGFVRTGLFRFSRHPN